MSQVMPCYTDDVLSQFCKDDAAQPLSACGRVEREEEAVYSLFSVSGRNVAAWLLIAFSFRCVAPLVPLLTRLTCMCPRLSLVCYQNRPPSALRQCSLAAAAESRNWSF